LEPGKECVVRAKSLTSGVVVLVFVTVAALYFSREILIPLAFALTLTFLLTPAYRYSNNGDNYGIILLVVCSYFCWERFPHARTAGTGDTARVEAWERFS
jgi:hypothetical protein